MYKKEFQSKIAFLFIVIFHSQPNLSWKYELNLKFRLGLNSDFYKLPLN